MSAMGATLKLKIKPGKEAEFEALFKELCARVHREEPQSIEYYALYRSREEPATYLMMERYVSEAAFQDHLAAPALNEVKERVAPLVEHAEPRYYDALT